MDAYKWMDGWMDGWMVKVHLCYVPCSKQSALHSACAACGENFIDMARWAGVQDARMGAWAPGQPGHRLQM
eukprot:231598-Pelagomonas_calceolata.AAC.11